MKVKCGTTGIPWCGFQGSGSSLFQETQPVTRAPRSQTMMLPIFACGGRDGVRAWRLWSCIVFMLFLFSKFKASTGQFISSTGRLHF